MSAVVIGCLIGQATGRANDQLSTTSERFQKRYYGIMQAIRFILIMSAITLAACSEQPRREVWAVVVSIAPHVSPKWDADEVVVTARSQDGAFGAKSVLTARLNCRVGDTVHASARGLALTLDGRACER